MLTYIYIVITIIHMVYSRILTPPPPGRVDTVPSDL